jgi:hypothetical protein
MKQENRKYFLTILPGALFMRLIVAARRNDK